MNNQHHELDDLGWNDWFEQRAKYKPTATIARVAAVDRGQLLLVDQTHSFRARLTGSYLNHHRLSHERPCVGDWVCLEMQPGEDFGMIHTFLERRTLLRRKSAGHSIEYQMIAANVDTVFIVVSCHLDFNLNRLERYLVMVMDGGAEPSILLTKTDLLEPADVTAQLTEIRAAGINVPITCLSNVTREGIDDLKRLLLPQKTYCFVGSSGVGKSTLINQLIGRETQKTKAVSITGEGRHTTVRRELIRLEGGALVIDNPGMREFGVFDADSGISTSYSDIETLSSGCHYRNCSHTGEPDCAVSAAVRSGEISREHLENFQKFKKESEFNQMSYVDKRKKDQDFGRYIKSVKKDLKD